MTNTSKYAIAINNAIAQLFSPEHETPLNMGEILGNPENTQDFIHALVNMATCTIVNNLTGNEFSMLELNYKANALILQYTISAETKAAFEQGKAQYKPGSIKATRKKKSKGATSDDTKAAVEILDVAAGVIGPLEQPAGTGLSEEDTKKVQSTPGCYGKGMPSTPGCNGKGGAE